MLATTVETLEVQVGLVGRFCAANVLCVNVQKLKCDVIFFDCHRGRADMGSDLEVEV